MSVKPARLSRCAYEGGAWNAKQSVLAGPHFDDPRTVSVPSRLPITTSPRSSCRIDAEKKPAPPSPEATMAMSPTQAIDTVREGELAPLLPTSPAPSAAASTATTARRVTASILVAEGARHVPGTERPGPTPRFA